MGALAPKGEFDASIAGDMWTLNTSMGTLACIERECTVAGVIGSDQTFIDAYNAVVASKRATARLAFAKALLLGAGMATMDASNRAAAMSALESEAMLAGFFEAMGFTPVAPSGSRERPLDETTNGASGDASPMAPSA